MSDVIDYKIFHLDEDNDILFILDKIIKII